MRKDASSLAGSERIHERKFERRSRNRGCIAAFAPAPAVSARFQHNQYLGAGLGIWGAINLLEGYGNDNPGAKSQGMKQLMAGGGVALIGVILVPLLSGLFG